MSGELTSLAYDLADHLTVDLAGAGLAVKVSPWPPDGVGEPAVWLEESDGSNASARRTVTLVVVVAVPATRRDLLASLTDAVWAALDVWHPVTPGVALDSNEVRWVAGTELIGGDTVPANRFTVPATYRPCT